MLEEKFSEWIEEIDGSTFRFVDRITQDGGRWFAIYEAEELDTEFPERYVIATYLDHLIDDTVEMPFEMPVGTFAEPVELPEDTFETPVVNRTETVPAGLSVKGVPYFDLGSPEGMAGFRERMVECGLDADAALEKLRSHILTHFWPDGDVEEAPEKHFEIDYELLSEFYNGVPQVMIALRLGVSDRAVRRLRRQYRPYLDALTPDLAIILFGQKRKSRFFDVQERQEDGETIYQIEQRVEEKTLEPDLRKLIYRGHSLFRQMVKPTLPVEWLPPYFIPVGKNAGVHMVICCADEVPDDQKTLDKATSILTLDLELPIPEEVLFPSKTSNREFEIVDGLLSMIHEQYQADSTVRVTRVRTRYEVSEMDEATYQVFSGKSLEHQISQLEQMDSDQRGRVRIAWQESDLQDELALMLQAYMDDRDQHMSESESGTEEGHNISDFICMVACTDRETVYLAANREKIDKFENYRKQSLKNYPELKQSYKGYVPPIPDHL